MSAPSSPQPGDVPLRYTWRHIFALVREHRRALIVAHLVAVGAAALSVPVPLLLPLLVDEVLLDSPGRLLAALGAVLPAAWQSPLGFIASVLVLTVVLRLASLALQVWQQRAFSLVSKDLIYRIRRRLLERLGGVAMAEYEALGGSTVASYLVVDLDTIDRFTGETLSRLVVAVLSLIGAAAVLLWMHWPLALFLLLTNPIAVYFTVAISKKTKELKRRENAAVQAFQEALTETLEAIQQIRAANRERHYLGRVTLLARDIRTHAAAFSWKSDAANRLSFTAFLVGIDGFRAVAMLMVVFSDLTLGQMIAVFGYLWYMLGPIDTVLNLQYGLQGARAALERVNRLLALRQEPVYPHLRNPFAERRANAVELRGVRFRYGDGPLILDGVDLTVRAGERVAIVGASGGGKSTLVQVILGLYQPEAGTLAFDGVPITEIGLDVVRSHIGTVLQHPALLNDSLRHNLTLGAALPEERLLEALEVAQLVEVVKELPQGLDTLIGRDGIRLSGGQRQRVAIARMLLADPNIVMLDEATSALDVDTEARLHAALARHLAGRTLIVIAHRLSAIRDADCIYVFDGGRIAERGAHQDLIRQAGLYQQLYGRGRERAPVP